MAAIRSICIGSLLLAAAWAAPSAHAYLVRPTSAVASSQFTASFDGRAVNTINGSGLPEKFCPNSVHADYTNGNHWTSAASTNPTAQFITWGFDASTTLDAIHIWNHRSNVPPANNSGYEPVRFDLTLLDASGATLLTLASVQLAPDTPAAQTFSFGSAVPGVKSVLFNVLQTQSSTNFTGLAEVAFNAPGTDPADFNLDGRVDTADLVPFLGLFGAAVTPGVQGDFNADGVVSTPDLVFFLGRFGLNCP